MLIIQNTVSLSSFIYFFFQFESIVNFGRKRKFATLTPNVIANYQKTDRHHGINAGKFF